MCCDETLEKGSENIKLSFNEVIFFFSKYWKFNLCHTFINSFNENVFSHSHNSWKFLAGLHRLSPELFHSLKITYVITHLAIHRPQSSLIKKNVLSHELNILGDTYFETSLSKSNDKWYWISKHYLRDWEKEFNILCQLHSLHWLWCSDSHILAPVSYSCKLYLLPGTHVALTP